MYITGKVLSNFYYVFKFFLLIKNNFYFIKYN
jgi:hypothetical protein